MDTEHAKKVAAKAILFVQELYSSVPIHDLRVEEIEFVPDKDEWHVTVGYDREVPSLSTQAKLSRTLGLDLPVEREYKRLEMRGDNLDVVRMTLRETVS